MTYYGEDPREYDDYDDHYADMPRRIQCTECNYIYESDELECPECGCQDFEEYNPRKYCCNHCGAEVHGDAYCNRCGERVHYDYDNLQTDSMDFADPGGRSALRAATPSNPRIYPCPNCGAPDRLTPSDRARGYQCDECADRAERGWDY